MRVKSLRTKLVIASVLPVLLFMPVLSLFLLDTLESFYTQELLQWLDQQGMLIMGQVRNEPGLLKDSAAARSFLADLAQSTDARVLLISTEGVILGSTRPRDNAEHIGMQYTAQSVGGALGGVPMRGTGPGLGTEEVAYVALPALRNGVVQGVLRLSYEVDDVRAQFGQLRWLVISSTAATAILAFALVFVLSRTLTSPINRLARSIQEIAAGNYQTRVEIQRQDELGLLATSFNQMAAQLAEAETMQQQQLASIVHELARPLTSMSVAAEVLLDDVEAGAALQCDLLAGVAEEVARLQRLVSTLQKVQKQIVQPLQIDSAPLSLSHVVCATVANFQPIAERLGIDLTTHAPADLPAVMADEDRLIQVLTNLLDNALKFTPRGGHITIEVEGCFGAEMVRISVVDTGTGIAPDELPHIFRQFYRGGGSQWPEKGGLGLGLAISQQIVAAHGGRIWAESEAGLGTRVSFTLPSLGEL